MAKVTRLSLDGGGGLDRRRLHLREISDETDAPLDTVGQDLRKARQRKGEDLSQISSALKLRKGYLEAIEESDFASLPGRAYAIGFVRSYAEYLGLDSAQCVGRLKVEIAGRDDDKEAKVALSPERDRRLPQGSVIVILFLLIALVYGVYYLISAASHMQAQPVTPVPARLEAQAANPPPPAPPPPVSEPVRATAPPAATAVAAAPTPPPAVAATPAPATAAPLPPGHVYGATNVNSRITVLATKPVHVVVVGADPTKPFLNRNLNPGDSYVVPNMIGLKLATPDAGAVDVVLDGTSAGHAGKDGVALEGLSLNPQDVVDHKSR